ncbi:MAG: hypothetical protein LUO93_10180 [Methanomicrobiales archaeon]|nr:hypothetical protein [Methanomicrobiales archaeon]
MPCTKITNKHLLPVYDRPMIFCPLDKLINAGIEEIMIVSGRGHAATSLSCSDRDPTGAPGSRMRSKIWLEELPSVGAGQELGGDR